MTQDGAQSPTATDTPLEYLTVESYEWPKHERPKRSRMEAEERRRRHREDQRRFMLRKHERVDALRREASRTEMQLHFAWALHQEKVLRAERRQIHEQLQLNQASTDLHSRPLEAPVLDPLLSDVLLSL